MLIWTECVEPVFTVKLPEKPDASVYTLGATRSTLVPRPYLRLRFLAQIYMWAVKLPARREKSGLAMFFN